ncbi:hypothetical protein LCGC14_1792300 [marine sediment metagenome]|uniref:Uncharacterized protein n=1 Tax=marine sediment metagenome TaxID=412755 RepID=A0A0F9GS66_9ZZZZ|nr:hypothetical protein [Candidatus Scalindua sp.]
MIKYEYEIREFCKFKNIPIRNNRIQPRHFGEIYNYLKKLLKRDKIHKERRVPQSIKEIMKKEVMI